MKTAFKNITHIQSIYNIYVNDVENTYRGWESARVNLTHRPDDSGSRPYNCPRVTHKIFINIQGVPPLYTILLKIHISTSNSTSEPVDFLHSL